MKKPLKALFLTLLIAAPSQVLAWGADGHRVVGEIAWHYLKPEVRIEVEGLLESAGEPSLAQSSTWADRIRSDSSYDWAAPLHYISLPRQWDGYSEKRDCPEAGCILQALDKFERVLADRKAVQSERAEALMFVAHFVGDLHQPLHTGLASDRGGNDVHVTFFGFPTNLHALWDVYLPGGFVADWRQYSRHQLKNISAAQVEEWQATDAPLWAAESQRLAHSNAYVATDNTDAERAVLGEDYYLNNKEIVAQRLRQGGVRLAAVLNRALQAQ